MTLRELADKAMGRVARAIVRRQAGQPIPFPVGHFYSPVPSLEEVRRRSDRIFSPRDTVPGVDLATDEQLALVDRLGRAAGDLPFGDDPAPGLRYHYANRFFGRADAVVLCTLLRTLRPKRLIEVGSGYSSALMLDTRDRWLDDLALTFVEPYPDRLMTLLRPEDRDGVELVRDQVQDVDLDRFAALEAGDVLFVDSSHVSKVGSDVNHLVFEVLPSLAPGVLIHFHDIGYPFEYPADWVYRGRAWNEAYLVRALLSFNDAFRIRLYNAQLGALHGDRVRAALPGWDEHGMSLWIERVA